MAMQLDHEQLHRLLEALGDSDIQEFRLEGDDFRLEIRRNLPGQAVVAPVMAAPVAAAAPVKPLDSASPPPAATSTRSDLLEITAPMVGTFYAKPNPDADSFVKVGDNLGPETVVCIIEAMKVFNEIAAEVSGQVVAMLVDNEEAVEFGKPLFKIDTSK